MVTCRERSEGSVDAALEPPIQPAVGTSDMCPPRCVARAGQHSIRVNDRYRVCFRCTAGGAEDVEIVDHHQLRVGQTQYGVDGSRPACHALMPSLVRWAP
jgi:hypothetical protein